MTKNLHSGIPDDLPRELVEIIASDKNIRIERIVSQGHATPQDDWYDQDENEFVLLISGEAKLSFENGSEIIEMKAGDYLIIPAHKRHRVEWTHPEKDTVWLAVFY
ncbi:cupin domain-containing protein [Candidatus Latescibacterota bacterium]